ncbi:MAG: acyl-CoA/acyl-ACP dehydrogenase [Proteobacteria bacterium]|nr:acyl-CoA/acyl-ACP dehydrogenase [Pseudomonadota bacterium]MBU1450701.1 acyl-CoA/acyl-ACP dehydrogenase [Pseudomonadota bacterium]
MDYSFTDEQMMLRDTIARFMETEATREVIEEIEKANEFPHALVDKLSELGFMGINVPEEYGGQAGTVIDEMILFEQIAKRLPVLAWAAGNVILYGNNIINTNGNQEQKEKFLPLLVEGKLKFCFALTEANVGSDAAQLQTKAELKDGRYVINGAKMFITGAGIADYVVTNARTGGPGMDGITAFLVPGSAAGYSASPINNLGHKGSNTCAVTYQDVEAGPEDILGGPEQINQGWRQMMRLLNSERLVLSSCAIGIAQAALDYALAYAKERVQFGRPIGRFQAIQNKLVNMATEVEAARRLAYYAGWMEVNHMPCVKETSMAKLYSAEVAKRCAMDCVQILWGYGYAMEYDAQRFLRDSLVYSIGGGTSEIQMNIIAKQMGL